MEDDDLAISQVLQQAPAEATEQDAKNAYYNASRNVAQAVADLWNLPPPLEKPKKTGEDADKWDEVRKICDEFDAEATRTLADALKHSRQQAGEAKVPTVSVEEYIAPK